MTEITVAGVARLPRTTVTGTWYRHTSLRVQNLAGSLGGGRWGKPGAFPVLYLGQPPESVIVEAHRHLVDAVEGMTTEMVAPRRQFSCAVAIDNVIDLREAAAWDEVGLTMEDLTTEVGDYGRCQALASRAHQISVAGIVAPAATGAGETLALFPDHISAHQFPIVEDMVIWERLPADPRRLRIVRDDLG